MEADAFLTLFINKVDKVSAADADYAELRDERLMDLNEVAIDFVQSYDFSWMLSTDTLTVQAGSSEAELPSNFDNFGAKGGIWRSADGEPLEYRDPDKLMTLRLRPGNRPTLPDVYSIFEISGSIAGGEVFQTEILGADCAMTLLFKKNLPAITDTGATTDAFSPLANIPEAHQRGAIWIGMMCKVKSKDQDFRNHPAYMAAKQAAIKSDQKGKEKGGQLPSCFGD